LANWYSISDIYLFPTLFEWFWRTAIEAQACWCPVITTNADGVKEIVWDSWFIIQDPLNQNELYEWIMKISSNSVLREELAQKWIKNAKKFSKQTNKNIILEMFQDNLK
jgi:glycosyltransferase involved in cell wall biosynthesis